MNDQIVSATGPSFRFYPRPQLRRESWQSLNGTWRFLFDKEGRHEMPSDIQAWPLAIEVPFAPETPRSGIADTGFHPVCWYQRDFEVTLGEGRLILHFGAVDYQAKVWVNDQYLGAHEGGHTPFHFDITHALRAEGPQTVTVRVEDDPLDLAKPRGKQDWKLEPHSIWYPRTTGIWQTVWMEEVSETYIERIRWTPQLTRWEVGFECTLSDGPLDDLRVHLKLSANGQVLADDRYTVVKGEVMRHIPLSDPGIDDFRNEILWSPESPTLIEAEVELWRGHTMIDKVQSYTALRSVDVQHGSFMLNGRPYYLRLILDQGYWGDTFLTPPSDAAIKRDIRLVKTMGFNGVRKHQKIEDPAFLYWADVMGLLVWEEMPSAYRYTQLSVERVVREWLQVIDRDINHPCIVAWVPFNESWGVPDLPDKSAHRSCVQAMYHLTKSLDPTRPVIGNDGWENTATDIIGIHDYENDPEGLVKKYGSHVSLEDVLRRRIPAGRMVTLEGYAHSHQPVMLTEFGGIAYSGRDKTNAKKDWGYGKCQTVDELETRYADLMDAVHKLELVSGFCYTQLTDTFQEANGLLFADRTPKFPLPVIASATKGVRFGQNEAELDPTFCPNTGVAWESAGSVGVYASMQWGREDHAQVPDTET